MPCYYFDIAEWPFALLKDEEGEDLPDHAAACAHAGEMIRELRSNGGFPVACTMVVSTAEGEIARIRFAST
jgi:hypothetical protein